MDYRGLFMDYHVLLFMDYHVMFTGYHGLPWTTMGYHGQYHGLPWTTMGYHGLIKTYYGLFMN